MTWSRDLPAYHMPQRTSPPGQFYRFAVQFQPAAHSPKETGKTLMGITITKTDPLQMPPQSLDLQLNHY